MDVITRTRIRYQPALVICLDQPALILIISSSIYHITSLNRSLSQVKAALDAHGEFAEALEHEQRLIVERLTDALQREGAQRHDLMKRLGVVEMDCQKVRGHLPILFASPTAFR